MMEFTLSRVVMGVCGLLVLAAALSPLSMIYNEKEDVDLQQQCDTVARMMDAFDRSSMNKMTLQGDDLIPDGSVLRFDEREVIITYGEKDYRSITSCVISSSDTYTDSDIICVYRLNGHVQIEKEE